MTKKPPDYVLLLGIIVIGWVAKDYYRKQLKKYGQKSK